MRLTLSDLLRRHAALHDSATASHEPRRDRACDTCHANKTRCSGGVRCSLCAKRGVSCTYNRGNPAAGRDEAVDDTVQAEPLPLLLSDGDSNASLGSSSPELLTLEAPALLQIEDSENHDADQQLNFDKTIALNILYRVLTKQAPGSPSEPQAIPRLWLTARIESYLATFHPRWPVLHAPVINETTDSIQVLSTIVMADLWLNGDVKLKDQILRIHENLVRQLYRELVMTTLNMQY